MKNLTDADILGTKKTEWNTTVVPGSSTSWNHPVSAGKNMFDIHTGMRDETIIQPRDQTTYLGTDTREVYHDGWNVSIQCPIPLHQAKSLQQE